MLKWFILKVTRPFACVGFVSCICLYILCFLLDLSWEIKSMDVRLRTMYLCLCWSLFASCCILYGSCEWLMDYPILGEWYALGNVTSLKMCVHEEYHLVLILQVYLVSMWYVILMRNSSSIMSINYLLLVPCCLLWK